MRFIFLDIYKRSNHRISKDTAGGYGTGNDLGSGIFGRILSKIIKYSVFWPNLSFAQLLQELISAGHYCKYYKLTEGENLPELSKYDAIFICSSIVCFETELNLVKAISSYHAGPIFLCGTFITHTTTLLPQRCVVMSGNYEFSSISHLVESIKLNHFNNIPLDPGKRLACIKWGENGLPIPRNYVVGGFRPYIPYIFNRGCPYSCAKYCTYPTTQGNKVLQGDIATTIDDLKLIEKLFPGAHVVFRDPVFSINLKRAKELMRAILKENISLEFSAELHLKNLDDEFIELANLCNLRTIKFGIESALDHIRSSSSRYSIDNDSQILQIKKLHKNRIKTVGMFILGQPTDTHETCLQTIEYATKLNLDIAQFSIFTPYPGTEFFKDMSSLIITDKYEHFDQYRVVFRHKSMNPEDIRHFLELGYKKFIFSKFKRIFNQFKFS